MRCFAIVLLFTSVVANAEVVGSFRGDCYHISIQGAPGDMDAPHLYDALNVEPVDENGTLKKTVEFKMTNPVLSVECTLSKLAADYGFCTMAVCAAPIPFTVMNDFFASMSVPGAYPEAALVLGMFNAPNSSGEIFVSTDKKLGISAKVDEKGRASFRLDFKNND